MTDRQAEAASSLDAPLPSRPGGAERLPAATVTTTAETRDRVGRALVVDDDSAICFVARRTLARAGLDVVSVMDGESAVEMFRSSSFDIVLMDVILPGIDGFAAVEELRRSGTGRHVPILMLTGLDDVESINRAYQAGATDFINKPINWLILTHRVRYMLRAAQASSSLAESEALLASAQQVARFGSWSWEPRSGASRWSEHMFRILGYETGEVPPSKESMLARVHPADVEDVRSALASLGGERPVRDLMHRVVWPCGTVRHVRFHGDILRDTAGVVPPTVYGALQDITETKEAETRVHELAFFDRVTQLPNRPNFLRHVQEQLAEAGRIGRRAAVLALDLDQFKSINDTFGHSAGNDLLVAVAHRLRALLSEEATSGRLGGSSSAFTLARFSGGEFHLLLGAVASFDEAARCARILIEAMQPPFVVAGHEMFVTISVGIALSQAEVQVADTLVGHADAAMHFAKGQGRNVYRFYDDELNAKALEKLGFESRLRKAMARGDFELHYQPKLNLASGVLVGAEALLRWDDAELGRVAPSTFIPIAEETGLIGEIGEWVLERALEQLSLWQRQGLPPMHVAVNIAAPQFEDPGFPKFVSRLLSRKKVDPSLLELEVTERMLVDDSGRTLRTLTELKNIGIRLSLDDFGTGYSSLSYLRSFPLDTLKVDRTFIKDAPGQESDAAITTAIIAMAHGLRMEVVAEGVETQDQMAFLRGKGCEYVQGYLISRPVHPNDFRDFVFETGRSSWGGIADRHLPGYPAS